MIKRLTDPVKCRKVTDKHLDYFTFDVEDWLANSLNFAFIEGDNVAFAEYKQPGIYWVHFCYDKARGRDAIELTKEMFKELCRSCPVEVAIGLIEVNNRKARWLIRQVGFKSLGQVTNENGLCEMFYTSKKEDNNGLFIAD